MLVLATLLPTCMTLSKSLYFSELRFVWIVKGKLSLRWSGGGGCGGAVDGLSLYPLEGSNAVPGIIIILDNNPLSMYMLNGSTL